MVLRLTEIYFQWALKATELVWIISSKPDNNHYVKTSAAKTITSQKNLAFFLVKFTYT